MAFLLTVPELATRYAPHIEDLRDFFTLLHLHCGEPEDLVALAGRLETSGSFREEMTSMVRAILLREGRSVPRVDLLEMVTIAIGGAEIDEASFDMQPPVHQILSFLNGVLRMPWNQPPGEYRLEPQELASIAVEPEPVAQAESTEILQPASPQAVPVPAAPAYVLPEGIYTRLTGFESETRSPAPFAPALELRPSPWPSLSLAAELSPEPPLDRVPDRSPDSFPERAPQHGPAIEMLPLPGYPPFLAAELALASSPALPLPPAPIPAPIPAPTHAAAFQPHSAAAFPVPSTFDPDPPLPAPFPAMHLPRLAMHLPKLKMAAPRIAAAQIRIALMSAVAATLFVGGLMYSAHRSAEATLQAAARTVATPAPSSAPAVSTPASVPAAASATIPATAAPAKPSVVDPAIAHPQHSRYRDDGYVAHPYSTPNPPEPAARISGPGSADANPPAYDTVRP